MAWTTVLIEHPWLSLIPAGLLGWLWWATRSRVVLVAALLWVAYAGWEYAIGSAGSDADIRIDLLLIYPLLALTTIAAIIAGIRKAMR